MQLTVNGEPRSVRDGTKLVDLVRELNLEGRPIAIELNREVVPKTRFAEHALKAGDTIEIVSFVGGG